MAEPFENRYIIGSDPELFICDSLGKPITACGKFGGDKGNPIKMPRYGGYLEDGCALELNPTTCDGGVHALQTCLALKQEVYTKILKPKGMSFFNGPEVEFTNDQLADPLTQVIGCAMDNDAYQGGALRKTPDLSDFGNWRFAGGHIHVGMRQWSSTVHRHVVAQFMDFFLMGPWHAYDKNPMRKPHYGLPGLFRPKPYGLEYRGFSNRIFSSDFHGVTSLWRTLDSLLEIVMDADENEGTLDKLGQAYQSIDWGAVNEKLSKVNMSGQDVRELSLMQRSLPDLIDIPNFYGKI